MSYLVILLLGMLGAILQSALLRGLPLPYFTPNIPILLVIYASLFFPLGRGMILCFLLGLLGDLLSGAPEGWNALYATVMFFLYKGIEVRVFFSRYLMAPGFMLLAFALKLPYVAFMNAARGLPVLDLKEGGFVLMGELWSTALLMPLLFYLTSKLLGHRGLWSKQVGEPHST